MELENSNKNSVNENGPIVAPKSFSHHTFSLHCCVIDAFLCNSVLLTGSQNLIPAPLMNPPA